MIGHRPHTYYWLAIIALVAWALVAVYVAIYLWR